VRRAKLNEYNYLVYDVFLSKIRATVLCHMQFVM